MDINVILFTHSEYCGHKFPFIVIHSVCWILLFFILNSVAFVFIPLFFKQRHARSKIQAPIQRTKSLELIIICMSAFFIGDENVSKRIVLTGHTFLLSCVSLLAYYLTDRDVRHAMKRHLFTLFHIAERTLRLARAGGGTTGEAHTVRIALFSIFLPQNVPYQIM